MRDRIVDDVVIATANSLMLRTGDKPQDLPLIPIVDNPAQGGQHSF